MKSSALSFLVTLLLLWGRLPASAGCPPTPTSYCDDLTPGLSTFANHLNAPLNIGTLPMPPGQFSLFKFNSGSGGFDPFVYDPDAGGWNPTTPVLSHGEGAFIDNPGALFSWGPMVGPNTVTPFAPAIQQGYFLRGSQQVGQTIFKGTFESITGRSPKNYSYAVVYRYNPAGNINLFNGQYDAYNYANGKWYPSAPVMEVGEAVFLKLGTFIPYTPPTFTVNGMSPGEDTLGSTVIAHITGTGFTAGDQVQLRRPGGGLANTIPGTVISAEQYVLKVSFNTTGKNLGWYRLRVQCASCIPWTIVNNAFYLKPAGASLKVKLIGPNITSPFVNPTYHLAVNNTGGSTTGGARVGVPNWASWTTINPLALTTTLPYVTTTPTESLPGSQQTYFPFKLKASAPMVGSTKILTNEIFAPAAEAQFTQFALKVIASMDPNDKYGPQGFGPAHHVSGLDPFDYLVTFQNQPSALAPAQYVEILDQLDTTRLDLSSFELGPVTFGPKVVVPPPGLKSWTTDVAYDVDGIPTTLNDNILVRITGKLDDNSLSTTYGQVKWTFASLESSSPFPPVSDPTVGFLPPDNADGVGEGSVTFKISPYPYLPSGDVIANEAKITFDANAPIITPTWANTIDVDNPDSSVQALPAAQNSPSFTVNWGGTDSDSGIASYDIYVSDNNGPFTLWQTATAATSAIYAGQATHTYAFYSVATDNLGNVEEEPENPDATSTVQLDSYQLVLHPGLTLIGIHLNVGGNTVEELFPFSSLSGGVTIQKFNPTTANFDIAFFDTDSGGWVNGAMRLQVGDAAFFDNATGADITVTLSGTPLLGAPHPRVLPLGDLRSMASQVNGPGTLHNIIGNSLGSCTKVELYRFNPTAVSCVSGLFGHCFDLYTYTPGSGWDPSEPVLAVGEGCFLNVSNFTSGSIVCPANIEVQALPNQTSVPVTYSVGVASNSPSPSSLICTPPSGSSFSNGLTTVTCVATFDCGNTDVCSFTVTVIPPVVDCVTITNESFGCTDTNGVVVYRFCVRNQTARELGYFTVVDMPDGVPGIPYFVPLPQPLAPGQTVCLMAGLSDVASRSNLCFRLMAHSRDFADCCTIDHCTPIIASDITPPVVNCPTNMVVRATAGATNAIVTYAVTATDDSAGPVSVVCTPPSGATFQAGVTTVTCVATDPCGNTNTCSFTVTVLVEKGDLFVADTPYNYTGAPDQGREPDPDMVGQNMWMSSAVWVHQNLTQPDGTHLSHQNPRYGQDNRVFAEVKNRGGLPITGANVEIWFVNASLGLSWPTGWTLIGTASLPTIGPGGSHIAHLTWRPPGTGHYCLVARIVSVDDPMTVAEGPNINVNVRANNNLAWRNVNVADCLHQIADKVEVRVRNPLPTPKRLTLVCKVGEDFLTTGGEVALDLGPLFARWQAAGGHGTNVIPAGGTRVRCTGSPARLEDIPFDGDEEHVFNITFRALKPMPKAGTNHVYHVGLVQLIDGEEVGGVNYGVVCRALHTDTDGDGIVDVDDPDDDNDGVLDDDDAYPLGAPDCLPASLTIRRVSESESVVTWSTLSYRLQTASELVGPWQDVIGATSPYTVEMTEPQRFYRLICP